jgi:mannose-1-phosphate guanylyltransferase/mannose-6-phosphate isomerase
MYAVILAGGGGTRLWPLSRPERPKPFLPLLGGESLLTRTAARVRVLVGWEGVHVVADRAHLAMVREQLPEVPDANIVVEPVGRNTAAAVALAVTAIDRPDDEVMAVLPADHHIGNEELFRGVIEAASRIASGSDGPAARAPLVTLGIQPTGPETGYGYIVPDPASVREVGGVRAYQVDRFIEKPDRAAAERLATTPGVAWNSGIFVGRRDTFRRLLERHAKDVIGPIRDAAADADRLAQVYPTLPENSFDYAVAEPASRDGELAVIPMDVGWSDLGSWAALLEILGGQDGAVVRRGRAEDLDSRGVLVESAGQRLVVTIGLRDTIVVDTPDVVLVCARDRAQDVKTILRHLAQKTPAENPPADKAPAETTA